MRGPLGVRWVYIHVLSHRCCLLDGELIPELVAPIIERIGSGCASNPMRVLIRLTAPLARHCHVWTAPFMQGLI